MAFRSKRAGLCQRPKNEAGNALSERRRPLAGRTSAPVTALLTQGSDWAVRDAKRINDRGQILCIGVTKKDERSLLLTPIPR